MPSIAQSAAEILARSTDNRFRNWPFNPKVPPATAALSAASRLNTGAAPVISHQAKFRLDRGDRFFSIGSCFARNVENALVSRGFNVLTADFAIPANLYKSVSASGAAHRGALNKYHPHSMTLEIKRALGGTVIANEGLVEVEPGLFIDPQLTNLLPAPFDEVLALRRQVTGLYTRIRQASVVFLTLGLTETWFDTQTGVSLNTAPSVKFLKTFADRLHFKNTTCAETGESLKELVELITANAQPGCKIIITVSPVPLGTTFSGHDVIQANCHSKSTLRCAAGEIAEAYDNVDYFPSYELVSHTPRSLAYGPDGAHVAPAMVQAVMGMFTRSYGLVVNPVPEAPVEPSPAD